MTEPHGDFCDRDAPVQGDRGEVVPQVVGAEAFWQSGCLPCSAEVITVDVLTQKAGRASEEVAIVTGAVLGKVSLDLLVDERWERYVPVLARLPMLAGLGLVYLVGRQLLTEP